MKKILLLSLLFVAMISLSAQAQILNTSLTLTVRDELGNTVEGATVQIFDNEADYLAEQNILMEDVTDKKGVVKFKKLDGKAYYVLARKGDINNAGGGELIGELEEGKFNKATVIIQ